MQASCDTEKQPIYKSWEPSAQRKRMKRNYYENGGRVKSLLKYYGRKFKDDEHAQSILKNPDLALDETLKEIKLYNISKKMNQLGI